MGLVVIVCDFSGYLSGPVVYLSGLSGYLLGCDAIEWDAAWPSGETKGIGICHMKP